MKCPYHKNVILKQSVHTPSSYICPKCKEEKKLGLRDNDGIWHESNLPSSEKYDLRPSNFKSEYFLTNNRYVDGHLVKQVLESVFNINEDESKRIVFDTHVYGQSKLKNCDESKMKLFNQKMKDHGYPQNILKKNITKDYEKQDIFDTKFPSIDLDDEAF